VEGVGGVCVANPVKCGRSGEAVQTPILYYISYISYHVSELLGSPRGVAVVAAAAGRDRELPAELVLAGNTRFKSCLFMHCQKFE